MALEGEFDDEEEEEFKEDRGTRDDEDEDDEDDDDNENKRFYDKDLFAKEEGITEEDIDFD